jgi:hypothetical protein
MRGDEPAVMSSRRSTDVTLVVAGLLTCGMALYHFALPFTFRWGDAISGVPPALGWALFMLNASFSYLLLAGGVLTLATARRAALNDGLARLVGIAMGGYWLFNALYQVVSPLPLPRSVAALRWAFLGFSVAIACLYAASLAGRRAPAARVAHLPRRSGAGGAAR